MTLSPGMNLGPYKIVEQVGRGGMATVYKAYHAPLARYVAVKVLPDTLAGEPGFKERFQREAVSVAQLRHPNILAVHDYGEENGITYIVNEFVDGGTLSDQLGHPLPVDYVSTVLAPVASALDYAHARGVLHRDVKPSNILMSVDGTPILGDFGLAKMMEAGAGSLASQSGMIVGTPEYMAPEQCAGDPNLTRAADIYSLCVVAYQMLTGQLPFSAATPVAVILAQMQNELPPPRSINPEIPESVELVLLKGLAKQPEDRHKNATAMIRSLADPGAHAPGPAAVQAPAVVPTPPTVETAPAPQPAPPAPAPQPAPAPPPQPAPASAPVYTPPAPQPVPQPAVPGAPAYADFGRRLAGCLLDWLILIVVGWTLTFILTLIMAAALQIPDTASDALGTIALWTYLVVGTLIGWVYYASFEASSLQATPGKRVVNQRVTDAAGRRLSFGKASGRYFAKLISAAVCYLGFLYPLIDQKKRALHDLIAGTLVLEGKAG